MQISKLKIQKLSFVPIWLFTFYILNFYGCATYPRREEIKKTQFYSVETFRIGKTDYVFLKELCRVYDLVWDWDILERKLTLYRDGLRIVLSPGASIGLVNDKAIDLKDKVRIYNHEIVIPFSLVQTISEIVFPSISRPSIVPGIYKIKRIMLDPGHGGRDPGAVGPGGVKEKVVVLDIAKRLKKCLESRGIEVILTRNDDRFISLWRRTNFANRKKADLFISIHANSSKYREARGFEIYYHSDRMDESSKALAQIENASLEFEEGAFLTENTALAATLWDIVQTQNRAQAMRLANYIEKYIENIEWVENRGVKGANFYVLRGANMPAILIETGFISNRIEGKRLADPYYAQSIAEAISKGIFDFVKEYEETDGFTR